MNVNQSTVRAVLMPKIKQLAKFALQDLRDSKTTNCEEMKFWLRGRSMAYAQSARMIYSGIKSVEFRYKRGI